MAFVPNDIPTGARVRLTRDVAIIAGTFKAGTEMTVTGIGAAGGYNLKDDEGNALTDTVALGHFFEKV